MAIHWYTTAAEDVCVEAKKIADSGMIYKDIHSPDTEAVSIKMTKGPSIAIHVTVSSL